MARSERIYICTKCASEHARWQGQCSHCGEWNVLEESFSTPKKQTPKAGAAPKLLGAIEVRQDLRFTTGASEFDRVLGGGLVAGSVILIGGNPGAGKSTLLMQALGFLAQDHRVCYVSGEESSAQIVLHARRLGLDKRSIHILAENDLGNILQAMDQLRPQILVIDSIQVMHTGEQSGAAGGVSQVRECSVRLMEYAKSRECSVLIVGHVTKEGSLAGPRVLEHLVDASLLLESTEDTRYRTLRALKNRFGKVNEVGIFAMLDSGLKSVRNSSAIFLSQAREPSPGSVTAVVREGSRPMLVEIQALVDPQVSAYPRQLAVGLDTNRIGLLLAVLGCHCGIAPKNNNVYINVVGGLRVEETATDLPVLLALVSVLKKRPLPARFAAFGELGLNGEIRPSPYGQERIAAAARHGFNQLLVPKANAPGDQREAQVRTASHLNAAIELAFDIEATKQTRKKAGSLS